MSSSPEATQGLFWSPDLVRRFPSAAGPEDAIRLVGGLLIRAGAVTPAHVRAALARELEHPTGLPAAVPFALVHTDAPGALRLAAALGVFAKPVGFRRMDDPTQVLAVHLVVMLAAPDRHMQADLLSQLIGKLTDPDVVRRLLVCAEPEVLRLLSDQAA